MSGRVRNFRRRADDTDADDADDNKPQTNTKKPQSKPSNSQKPKKPNLLSFADDDESADNTPPITRTSTSQKPNSSFNSTRFSKPSVHKLTSAKDRNSSKQLTGSSLPSNVLPQAGTYTKEALLELQKNSKTLGSSSSARYRPPVSKLASAEPVIVLKGVIKPVSEGGLSINHEDDEESDKEDLVPDQAMIDAIRAKRERLRKSGPAAPDFIALDGGSNHGEAEGLSDEEPEFQGRIALIGEKNKNDARKGVFEDVVDLTKGMSKKESEVGFSGNGFGVDDEEDEEDKMWEEEQVRKGLGKRIDEGVVGRGVSSTSVATTGQRVYSAGPSSSYQSVSDGPSIGGSVGWASGSKTLSITQQAEVSRKALYESVKRLKETHSRTLTSLTKTDELLADSLAKVAFLENALNAAGDKFIFMQKLRDYVSVICDFLQDKAPYLEELEDQMQTLHKKRAGAIFERRTADSNDELTELEASVNAAMAVFNKGGTSTSMVEAATTAAQAALIALRESKNLPVKLDEFGRDENLQKRMDMKRRAEARQRRKARSESKRMSAMETDSLIIEGESSTDESDSDSSAYESNRDQLLQVAGQIFSDADEKFSQLSSVKEEFENWKKEYSSSYRDAYMSLSIRTIFSPYVRLELLKWDPLHEDSDFFNMKWHGLLYDYGMSDDRTKVNLDDVDADADDDLVPNLVEKVAVPLLQHELAHCWDMLSTNETRNAVSATKLVISYFSHSRKAVSELVSVLHSRLSEAVSNLMVPTWNTYVLKAVPNAARFSAYRFGVAVRLLRNICLWNNILSTSVLEKLALDELLSAKILPHLRSVQSNIEDAITRTERVVASMSGVWAGPEVTGERSPRLQPMVDYLSVLGRILEKKQSYTGTTGLARKLKKMLVELNEYDHARHVSRTFNLKEAL
ncbi:transcriptional repressor ILP1-like [Bidens hawaiensis]|uniref:transcriptional repressor ILP1-like n=1 Tax=Bidens hawaiensis TaxID=980011 RepID=UPI00404B79E8